jgi:hypothetical protein
LLLTVMVLDVLPVVPPGVPVSAGPDPYPPPPPPQPAAATMTAAPIQNDRRLILTSL